MAVHALRISALWYNIFHASKQHGFYTVLLSQIFTLSLLLSTKENSVGFLVSHKFFDFGISFAGCSFNAVINRIVDSLFMLPLHF